MENNNTPYNYILFDDRKNDNPQFLIFLHGFGADNTDLGYMYDVLKTKVSNVVYIGLNGIKKTDFGMGYQWFDLDFNLLNDMDYLKSGLEKSYLYVERFLEYVVKKYNTSYDKINLLGFSQGGMLSVFLGLKIKNKLKNIICHSGMLIDSINSEDIINKDNFFTIIHGNMDEVIYVDKFNKTIELMEKFGISGNSFLIKDLGHSFSRESIEIVEKILNN